MEQQTKRQFSVWSNCFTLEVLLSILSFMAPTSVRSTLYSMDNNSQGHAQVVTLFQHFNEPFDHQMFGKLNIDLVQTTTSSLHVQWSLTNLTYPDSVLASSVLCETSNGKIVSDKLLSDVNWFNFQFLSSNTKYLVCVYLLEKSKFTNTSILHYNCQTFSTIPVMRSDSILGVILSIGYLLLMGAVGCLVWFRKTTRIKRREDKETFQIDNNADDGEENYYCRQIQEEGSKLAGLSNDMTDESRDQIDVINGAPIYKATFNSAEST